MLPPWVAGLSAAVLILQTLLVMARGRRFRSLWSLAPASPSSESQEDLRPSLAFVEKFKNYINGCGGVIIFTLQIIRLVACNALLGLFGFSFFLKHEEDLNSTQGLALIATCVSSPSSIDRPATVSYERCRLIPCYLLWHAS